MRRVASTVGRIPPALWALTAALVVVVAVFARWEGPWLTRQELAKVSTPVPPAVFNLSLVTVKPGQQACVVNVTLPAEADQAGLAGSVPGNRRPPELSALVSAPGHVWRGSIPAGWPSGLNFHYDPPARDTRNGRVCLTNEGRVPFVLNATNEAGASGPASSTLDGKATSADVALELRRNELSSRLSRAGEMLSHAADFSWRPLSGGVLKVLVALVIVLVPVGGIGAVLWAMESDRRREDEGLG